MKTQNIISINPNEFGIEQKQSDELIGNLPQIKNERDLLEKQFNDVIQMDLNDPSTSKIARELRLKIRDNRTKGIMVWHKTNKNFFLRGGQFIDAIKNVEIAVNERMENDLEQIENHFEIMERERINKLREKRFNEIERFREFVPMSIDLGSISDDEFEKLLNGAKLQFENAEIQRETERIEREQREQQLNEQRERDRLEREKLERELEIERAEKFKMENELRKQQQQRENELRLETEKREKLKKQPIQNQLFAWIESMEITIPDGLENVDVANEIHFKFTMFKSWANLQIKKM
jgi:hypothetical protein